jgi:hypothetical protein
MMQAARRMALGWLNVVSHTLFMGELLPAPGTAAGSFPTLLRGNHPPERPPAEEVHQRTIEEMRRDIFKIDGLYPDLSLSRRWLASGSTGAVPSVQKR